MVLCGISRCFHLLSPCLGQIAHALLTRPPLKHLGASSSMSPLDLHVLGTPPAFVLSQDQTLMFNPTPPTGANRSMAFLTRSESDCSFCSYFSISFSRIAPSPFSRSLSLAPLATTLTIIPTSPAFVKPFFHLFSLLFLPIIMASFMSFFAQFLKKIF